VEKYGEDGKRAEERSKVGKGVRHKEEKVTQGERGEAMSDDP
jgi:hypothetical protein